MINIPEPCPVQLMRMNKNDCGFYCKSCTKNVIDYRGMTETEINKLSEPGGCGIFDSELINVPSSSRTVKKRIIYYSLALCSLIGFNVSSASAQSENSLDPKDSVSIDYDHKKDIKTKKLKKIRHRNYKFWRKKKSIRGRRITGVRF